MSYATQADIEAQYPGALDVSAPRDDQGNLDAAAIQQALEYADNRIDELLGSRYTVPIPAPVPDAIIDIAVDLALHRLSTGPAATEDKKDRHDEALSRLRDAADGRIVLPGLSLKTATGQVHYSGQPRRFGRDKGNW